jgi:C1A family cysteine protease/PKD repeat protein
MWQKQLGSKGTYLISYMGLGLVLAGMGVAQQLDSANDKDDQEDLVFQGPDGELLGTGARRPTPEQWAWSEEHMVKTKAVKLNKLGLERLNHARARRGERPLTEHDVEIAPIGAEVVGATDEADARAGGATAPEALPPYVDNSALSYFPPIRSQGSLNSCAQFSAVYYTLTHMTALARSWDAKTGGDTFRFSPKWTYNMVNGGANTGSTHYDAFAIAMKHGLATWAEFPYDTDYRAWCLNPAVWRNALNVRAYQTGKVLDVDTDAGLSQLKQLLANGYILNFATYINSWQWKTIGNDPATAADDSFAGKQCVYMVNGSSGGHGMTVVGYNDDLWVDINSDGLVSANEKGALRIANSWGTGWGEGGFCWIAYQALRTRNPAYSSEGLFWYDEATWVTARSAYSPQLVAEFTLNHLKRSQLRMTLGISDTTASSPTTTWAPNRILNYAGGPYAFDGTSTARDGTFYFDASDLIPSTPATKRYYLGMYDAVSGDVATLKSFKLVNLLNGNEIPCNTVPQYGDANQTYASIDYNFTTGTLPPVAVASATPTSGNIALLVSFDGSASYDPDGSIASHAWDFGDGTSGVGATCQHTYTETGTFTVTLTVTDNSGASNSTILTVTAIDPDQLNAPSNLTGSVSSRSVNSTRTVTLSWTDNSNNETGFYIERAAKAPRSTTPFSRIATVGANVTTYSEILAVGTYYYRVQAVNSSTGTTSPYSNTATARVK